MSYSFRDKPRLSDRYRGKTSDEILNEFKSQLDQDRKMFFEGSPNWSSMQGSGTFPRSGFPFDDEMMPRGRQDVRAHLDDLAQRHPEFAEQLRCPPWGGEMGSPRGLWGRKRRGSGSCGEDDSRSQASGTSSTASDPTPQPPEQCEQEQNDEPGPLRGRSRYNHLPQYGLRNTVDLGQQQHESEQEKQGRGQRSWSAPPDNRTQIPADQPQRYVSRIDINPLIPGSGSSDNQGKPPVAPKQHQSQPTQPSAPKQAQGSNVRHIPIFVEGRDEPVIPKNIDTTPEQVFSQRNPPQQTSFSYARPSQFTTTHQFQPQQPSQSSPAKARTCQQQQQQPPRPPQQEPEPEQEHVQQKVPPQHTKPPEVPQANDPIFRVMAVQKDVDALKPKVESFSGDSRRDKDYVYLDEMLTRNLLKLDDIETEGKDNVRQARKEVIRNIQRCISVLEAKVPSPDEQNQKFPGESAEGIVDGSICMETGSADGEGECKAEVKMELDSDVAAADPSNGDASVLQPSNVQDTAGANLVVDSTTDEANKGERKVAVEGSSGEAVKANEICPTDASTSENSQGMEVEQDKISVAEESSAQVKEPECQPSSDSSLGGSGDVNDKNVGIKVNSTTQDSENQEKSPNESKESSAAEIKGKS